MHVQGSLSDKCRPASTAVKDGGVIAPMGHGGRSPAGRETKAKGNASSHPGKPANPLLRKQNTNLPLQFLLFLRANWVLHLRFCCWLQPEIRTPPTGLTRLQWQCVFSHQ